MTAPPLSTHGVPRGHTHHAPIIDQDLIDRNSGKPSSEVSWLITGLIGQHICCDGC